MYGFRPRNKATLPNSVKWRKGFDSMMSQYVPLFLPSGVTVRSRPGQLPQTAEADRVREGKLRCIAAPRSLPPLEACILLLQLARPRSHREVLWEGLSLIA